MAVLPILFPYISMPCALQKPPSGIGLFDQIFHVANLILEGFNIIEGDSTRLICLACTNAHHSTTIVLKTGLTCHRNSLKHTSAINLPQQLHNGQESQDSSSAGGSRLLLSQDQSVASLGVPTRLTQLETSSEIPESHIYSLFDDFRMDENGILDHDGNDVHFSASTERVDPFSKRVVEILNRDNRGGGGMLFEQFLDAEKESNHRDYGISETMEAALRELG